MARSTIITGQFVRINQVPASAGERLLARIIDYIFLFFYMLACFFIIDMIKLYALGDIGLILIFCAFYLPAVFYSLLCEVFNHGQSLGKRALNIRVVKADGTTPTLGSYLLRWLLFIVDGPLTSGMGLVVILVTKNSQRLGDLAAGTMVIKEHAHRKIQVSLDEFNYLTDSYRPTFVQAADLSLEQINVIQKTLDKKTKDRALHVRQLADKIKSLLKIPQPGYSDEQFLHTLLRDYQYYALEDI